MQKALSMVAIISILGQKIRQGNLWRKKTSQML
jgi:hypothetical protein